MTETQERSREANRRYREANRDVIRERQRAWRAANRNAVNEQDRQRRAADPEGHRDRRRDYRERLKAQVLAVYGASCACCGTTERLTIDHVNGDGGKHRAALFGHRGGSSVMFWLWLIRNATARPFT